MGDLDARCALLERGLPDLALRPLAGRVTEVSTSLIRAAFRGVDQGAICEIRAQSGDRISAEVVAVRGHDVLLCPFGDTKGLSGGALVRRRRDGLHIPVGPGLLGRVIDAFCAPVDGLGKIDGASVERAVKRRAPEAMSRPLIATQMVTGIRAIDAGLALGHGQRAGIFGPPGAGKTTLMAALARASEVDCVVLALVGERGREVREFLERDLRPEQRRHVVAVVATSDRPAIERALCVQTATTIAEEFRDTGKSVLLLVDNLTRVARALRDVALASGEIPTRRGFPASVFTALPELIERSGRSADGDITALYSVLLENEDEPDPIAEEVKSLTDGHIMLSRKRAEQGQFPAIDPLGSLSRVMPAITDAAHRELAQQMRAALARYDEVELLVQVGQYSIGTDPQIDAAIRKKPALDQFLAQDLSRPERLEATLTQLREVLT